MTRDEILALDGEALDEAVAERVMGWSIEPGSDIWNTDGLYGRWKNGWSPSRRWDHAGEVLEVMLAKMWLASINATGASWEVSFLWCVGLSGHMGVAEALTGPLAICRAALLAVCEE